MDWHGLRSLRRWFRRPARDRYRTVEVQPPSRADEGGWLFLAAGFVLLAVIYTYGFEREASRALSAATGSSSGLLPYQLLFRDLPSSEQRTFRAMQEGVGEAVRARGESGSWPAVETLAADGVPPFAPDVLDKAGLRWSARSEGLFANYLGVPSDSGAPAYLIFVQEPDPVTGEKPPPPSVVDEEHQLLADGTLLHVTYWKRPATGLRTGFIIDPAIEGWAQIRVSTPFEEMAKNENAQ